MYQRFDASSFFIAEIAIYQIVIIILITLVFFYQKL